MQLQGMFGQRNTLLVYVLVKLKTGSSLMLPCGSVQLSLINMIKHFAVPCNQRQFS